MMRPIASNVWLRFARLSCLVLITKRNQVHSYFANAGCLELESNITRRISTLYITPSRRLSNSTRVMTPDSVADIETWTAYAVQVSPRIDWSNGFAGMTRRAG